MTQSSQLITKQFANGAQVKKDWNGFAQNVRVIGAQGDDLTNDTTNVQAAYDDGEFVMIPEGTYKVDSLNNKYGKEFIGSGKIVKNGVLYNSYAYGDKVFGINYLSSFHKKIMAGTATKVVFTGDSTTEGFPITNSQYFVDQLFLQASIKDGFTGITVKNNGRGGKSTVDWNTSYVSEDLADNPDLLVWRWGINDPYEGYDLDQFINAMRIGLATIRAARPLSSLSIVLMSPSSTSDTPFGRDEMWYEKMIPAIKEAARDFQCCFIDTYGHFQDSRNASDWMDNPFGDGRHIHPMEVGNLWITSLIYDTVIPKLLRTRYAQAPAASVADVTLYVDGTNGNDANDGSTTGTAFKTIQAAINKLMKTQLINHLVFFNIADGVYNETVSFKGIFGKGIMAFQSTSGNPNNCVVHAMEVSDIKINLFISNVLFSSTVGTALSITDCDYVAVGSKVAAAAQTGIYVKNSHVRLDGADISGRAVALHTDELSDVYCINITGSGNTVVYKATAATIRTVGTKPSGTSPDQRSNGGQIIDENLFAVQVPTLQNGWVTFFPSTSDPGYYVDFSGMVHLKGVISGGTATSGTILFAIPAALLPAKVMFFAAACDTGYACVKVHTDGNAQIHAGTNGWLSLDGISFRPGV